MYVAAVLLVFVLSLGAVLLAVALQSMGELSTPRFVSAVAVVGFVTSWMVTGRVERETQTVSRR